MPKGPKPKPFCKNGHERIPENLNGRNCRLCQQEGLKAKRHAEQLSACGTESEYWDRVLLQNDLSAWRGKPWWLVYAHDLGTAARFVIGDKWEPSDRNEALRRKYARAKAAG